MRLDAELVEQLVDEHGALPQLRRTRRPATGRGRCAARRRPRGRAAGWATRGSRGSPGSRPTGGGRGRPPRGRRWSCRSAWRPRSVVEPGRRRLGHPLLEERLAAGAVGEALEQHRPVADRLDQGLLDGQVVVDEVELGLAAGAEEHLVRVGDRTPRCPPRRSRSPQPPRLSLLHGGPNGPPPGRLLRGRDPARAAWRPLSATSPGPTEPARGSGRTRLVGPVALHHPRHDPRVAAPGPPKAPLASSDRRSDRRSS